MKNQNPLLVHDEVITRFDGERSLKQKLLGDLAWLLLLWFAFMLGMFARMLAIGVR